VNGETRFAARIGLAAGTNCGAIFLDAVAGVNYTFAVPRRAPGTGLSLPNGEDCRSSLQEIGMANINFTLKNITKEIKKAEQKLRAIRAKVSPADQKKIDLELRGLSECSREIQHFCRPLVHYGQTFRAKPKKK
jgi:uncharacterized coiled-coil protein SlyX